MNTNTEPLPKKRRTRATLLLPAAALASAFAGLFFLPEIVSLYWHLRFGDSTQFHGWTVTVPVGWWAFLGDDELILQKMSRFYSKEDSASIVVGIRTSNKSVDPDALKASLVETLSKQGYAFQKYESIRIGTAEGFCAHFFDEKNHRIIRISCESADAMLEADLFGQASDITQFDFVISKIRPASVPR